MESLSCPWCGEKVYSASFKVGKVKCPSCGGVFFIGHKGEAMPILIQSEDKSTGKSDKMKANSEQKERLLDTKELMSYLGITSGATIRSYIRRGMPAYRVGLGYKFILDEIIEWIRDNQRVDKGMKGG